MAGNTPTRIVICSHCGSPIPLQAAERIAEEFSLRCPQCGQRGIYRSKDIKTADAR